MGFQVQIGECGLLVHEIQFVDEDVAALVLDLREAERVFDAAVEQDVAVRDAGRGQVADPDIGLRMP